MLFSIIQIVIVSLACVAASLEYLHVLQAERYQPKTYRVWLNQGFDHILKENVFWAFLFMLLSVYLPVLLSMVISVAETRQALADWSLLAVFTLMCGWIAWRELRAPSRRPLVITRRLMRLMGVLLLISIALGVVLGLVMRIPVYFLFGILPYLVLFAEMIIDPFEQRLNQKYFDSAKARLRKRKSLITIGIAGSFGKTQTKFILRDILSKKFRVLATPASFNTAMGISRVVNDDLTKEHQVFIAEMGASQKGDVRRLVELVRPRYGIITGIDGRRLDSFGSMEKVASTMFELAGGLPREGSLAVFGSGDDYIDRLYAKCTRRKLRVCLQKDDTCALFADRIEYSARGTSFTLWHRDGAYARCRTALLGRYAVKNILLAAALAMELGMSVDEIASALADVAPIEHRLQLIPAGEDGLTMIDDTLNDDAETAFEAMHVMERMPGRRVVVTPGLGDQKGRGQEVNYALGTVMAECVDTVILVGHRAFGRSVVAGLKAAGFSTDSMYTADDADAADTLLQQLTEPGDTVLFEGSIPDYEEEAE